MLVNRGTVSGLSLRAAIVASFAFTGIAWAQGAPRSFDASPDVYKVAAKNDQYLVIQVTWAPGQRDADHSHPVSAGYYLTNCKLRFFLPDGKTRDAERKRGYSFVQDAIPSHSAQNIGKSVCKIVMFEPK